MEALLNLCPYRVNISIVKGWGKKMKKQETNNEPAETGAKSSERALIEAQAAQEAREAAERQFIGDILADDNSDYG